MSFAKTTRPTTAGSINRLRLFRRLDRARGKPVTWIWGPPGAGKTTLVASYLAKRRLRSLWYQIDEGDSDIATFFYYLGQAAPRRRQPLPLLTPEYRQGLAIFSRRFFRELFSRLKPPFAVVFDNYQEIGVDSELHEAMRDAAAELPRGGRIIFLSRSEPPAAFARLRTGREVDLLDWSELRFTRSEASALIHRLGSKRWQGRIIDQLYQSSDGWAAGLVLLAEELASQGQTTLAPEKQTSQVIFDYFAGEIFRKADRETQDVLLQTAFLPRLTGAMANELTDSPRAGEILAELQRQNYFTNKRTGENVTYEFHPLFREFLLSLAARTFSDERRREIQGKAAMLAENMGQVESAAALLRDAEDWQALAGLSCRQAGALLAQGRGQTLLHWLTSIPETTINGTPWLLFWRGMCRFGSQHADCEQDLGRAFNTFRQQGDTVGAFTSWSTLMMAYEGAGNLLPQDKWTEPLDELLREVPVFPSEEVETHVAAGMLAVIYSRQPYRADGMRWGTRAVELSRRHPDLLLRGVTAFNWVLYQLQLGDVASGGMMVDEMRGLMRARDVSPTVAVTASMSVIWHAWLCALPFYRRAVFEMLELAKTTGMFYAGKHGSLGGGIFGALSEGDSDTAEAWIKELETELHHEGPGYHGWYHMFSLRVALLRGDIQRAATHQPEMMRFSLAAGWHLDNAVAHLHSAEVFHVRGIANEAQAHLRKALGIGRLMRSQYVEFMCRTIEAQIEFDNGREANGLRALARAMELGRSCGFVNSQIWIPSVMAMLCAKALEAGIEVDYVQDLVRRRGLVLEAVPIEIEAWPRPIKIYTLGRFSVLRSDQPIRFTGKVQHRPLALLKTIIALGGRLVREESLVDALWPESEGPAAFSAFTSAIHRLRKLLGHEKAIVRDHGEVSLDDRYCWLDVWAVDSLLGSAEKTMSIDETVLRSVETAARLHRGSFLQHDAEIHGALSVADRIRRRLVQQLIRVAQYRERSSQWQEVANVYEEALRVDSCAEDVYRQLMSAYHRLGRPAEVAGAYRRCREALISRLGAKPSAETEALFKRLQGWAAALLKSCLFPVVCWPYCSELILSACCLG